MNRRYPQTRFYGLLLASALLAGCPASKTDKVTIRGSNTVGEELLPHLISEYRKQRPDVTFDLEFKGTGYGFGALMNGQCDIAAASREANMNEMRLARERSLEFNDSIIGSYSVAVVVNAANPVTNLTLAQVRDIFTGAVQNWKEVGGPDGPLNLYIRDPISGTYLGFRELAMENQPYALGHLKTFTNYDSIVQAVAGDPGGVGYCAIQKTKKPGVKGVPIGGVAPVVFSVNEGKYPYARVLRLCTDKGKEGARVREFIQFVQSARGQAMLDEMGYVPRP